MLKAKSRKLVRAADLVLVVAMVFAPSIAAG